MNKMDRTELESAILSALMFSPKKTEQTYYQILKHITADDFKFEERKKAFEVIGKLIEQKKTVDPIMLAQYGVDKDTIYYMTMMDVVAANGQEYAKQLKHLAVAEDADKTAREMVAEIWQDETDSEEVYKVLADAQNKLAKLSSNQTINEKIRELKPLISETLNNIADLQQNKKTPGIKTKFPTIDKCLVGGLKKGQLMIVAARPAMGKTAFTLNLAGNMASETDKPILIFSLEMTSEQLVQRLLASYTANTTNYDLQMGNLKQEQWQELHMAGNVLAQKNIIIYDDQDLSIDDIKNIAYTESKRHDGLGAVIIDYIGLIKTNKRRNRVDEVSEISRKLKMMGKDVDAPIIALSQLNRSVESREDKRPLLSDLRESGSIEQDADIVAMLYRDDYYKQQNDKDSNTESNASLVEFIIRKNRAGKRATIELAFDKEHSKMVEMEYN